MVLVNITYKESHSFFNVMVSSLGISVMKSIDIEDQGLFGIDSGRTNPYGR
jgi:hypothetical protein